MSRPLVLAAAALVAALAAAGPASGAPMLAPLKACYVSAGQADTAREKVAVTAQGFTPNASATVLLDGGLVMDNAQIDPTGAITGGVTVPYQATGERAFTLTITENGNPANTVSAGSLVTALGVTVTPQEARPSSRVRFRGRGFTGRPAVYAHYLRKSRVRRTVRLATATGACGTFDVRRRQLPIAHPHPGRWTVQIDQQLTWTAAPASVFVTLTIDLTRVSAAARGSFAPS